MSHQTYKGFGDKLPFSWRSNIGRHMTGRGRPPGKTWRCADRNVATWKVFLMSTCLMVFLLSVGSFLESWESIRQTPVKSKRLVSKREVLRQQKIRKQLHVNTGKTSARGNHGKNAAQIDPAVARLQPYSSMFAVPPSDWKPNEKTAASTGSPLL
jgi:hypothetical protein